jgi:type II secretory pathway pseudopilin PulG
MIELIAAMVIVGVAVAMAGVSFISFERIGQGINARNAQLAQQRMELILAEKRKSQIGFPEDCDGVNDLQCGPDPCNSGNTELDDVCDNAVSVIFKGVKEDNTEINGCQSSEIFKYCKVKVTVEGTDYYMNLYKYD